MWLARGEPDLEESAAAQGEGSGRDRGAAGTVYAVRRLGLDAVVGIQQFASCLSLARLRLALAMLPKSVAPTLMADIERDIDDIDRLIGQHLDFARTMEPEIPVVHDLREIVEDAVNKVRRQGAEIKCQARKPCRRPIAVNSLRRVLANLLDNAWRHGGGMEAGRWKCGWTAARTGSRSRFSIVAPA